MDLEKLVNVKNRGTAKVVYRTADNAARRSFAPGEVKRNISVKELEELTYVPGGTKLIEKYLIINDKEVCEYLGLNVEPEYFYGEEEVKTLLLNGTLDQLLDCLDFAPGGVLDLIKKYAVELKLNDVSKRQAIQDKLKFSVTSAIDNVEHANSKDDEQENKEATGRRAKPINADSEKKEGRRTAPVTPTYNRVDN